MLAHITTTASVPPDLLMARHEFNKLSHKKKIKPLTTR